MLQSISMLTSIAKPSTPGKSEKRFFSSLRFSKNAIKRSVALYVNRSLFIDGKKIHTSPGSESKLNSIYIYYYSNQTLIFL